MLYADVLFARVDLPTVDILPDLLKESDVKQSIKEVLAMGLGVFFMVIIALYE